MTYLFYKDVIAEIALQLNYSSVVHLLGRDYADEQVMEFVEQSNPFFADKDNEKPSTKKSKPTMQTLRQYGLLK